MQSVAEYRRMLVHGREDSIFPYAGIEWVANELSDRGAEVTLVSFDGGDEVGPLEPVAEALAPILAAP